jgi:alkylation response protein AidB-like acyl-CoA dehydrogenase
VTGELAVQRHIPALAGLAEQTFDIFEGTEQIQQLVISRAITGLRVE